MVYTEPTRVKDSEEGAGELKKVISDIGSPLSTQRSLDSARCGCFHILIFSFF